jgi:hypothetical protein
MGTHPSKIQGKWNHKLTQPKEKTKANNQQKSGENLMQRILMATKWKSTITKKNLWQKNCHLPKSTNDEGALAMMCGRDEEPWPSATAGWKIIMTCTHYKAMNTHCW